MGCPCLSDDNEKPAVESCHTTLGDMTKAAIPRLGTTLEQQHWVIAGREDRVQDDPYFRSSNVRLVTKRLGARLTRRRHPLPESRTEAKLQWSEMAD